MVLWLCESLVLFGVCCSLQQLVRLWSFARLADLGNPLSNLLLIFRRFHKSVPSWSVLYLGSGRVLSGLVGVAIWMVIGK